MNIISDKQLIVDYLGGDEKSLEVLVRRYLGPIFSFIFRVVGDIQEAEDITQEVFVKVWRNLKKFDQEKSFKTWIFTIAKNASIDFLRKKRAIPFSEFETQENENLLMETLTDPLSLPDELLKQADIRERLNLAMQKLTPQSRLLLLLRYNEHLTFREISEVLGEPLNTIKSRHRRAIIQLRKFLK